MCRVLVVRYAPSKAPRLLSRKESCAKPASGITEGRKASPKSQKMQPEHNNLSSTIGNINKLRYRKSMISE